MNKNLLWLLPLILFSIISLVGDIINHKFDMVDFEVYFRTAERMFGGEPIYRIESDGHFVYKYAPAAALYFLPFLPFGFAFAKVLFGIFLTAALAWGLATLLNLLQEKSDLKPSTFNINAIAFFSILAMVPHIHLEWHLGQVNLLLMVLFVGLIKLDTEGRQKALGILLGLSLFVKPFGLIFLPFLLVQRQFKALVYTVLSVVVIGFLPFLFYPSWVLFSELYISWFNELQIELATKQDLLAQANHTIFSVLARYSPIQYLLTSPAAQKIYQLLVLGIMGICFLVYWLQEQKNEKTSIGAWVLLISWIPLIAFTSQNAFIYTFPLVVYLLFYYREYPVGIKFFVVFACFLIGINMYDIVGKTLHNQLMLWSIYTFGSVGLTVVAFYRQWAKPTLVLS